MLDLRSSDRNRRQETGQRLVVSLSAVCAAQQCGTTAHKKNLSIINLNVNAEREARLPPPDIYAKLNRLGREIGVI